MKEKPTINSPILAAFHSDGFSKAAKYVNEYFSLMLQFLSIILENSGKILKLRNDFKYC